MNAFQSTEKPRINLNFLKPIYTEHDVAMINSNFLISIHTADMRLQGKLQISHRRHKIATINSNFLKSIYKRHEIASSDIDSHRRHEIS